MKLLSKHKLFIWLLFSLALLAIGSFFAFGSSKPNNTESESWSYKFSIKAFWDQPNHDGVSQGSDAGGNWTSFDGNEYSGSLGTVTGTYSSSGGGSWDNSAGTITNGTTDADYTRTNFSVSSGHWFDKTNCTLSMSASASATAGFMVRSGESSSASQAASGFVWNWGSSENGAWSWWVHFTPCAYTVTFDANGGTHSTTTTTKTIYYYNNYQIISAPTRTGYTFDGWFTDPDDGEGDEVTTDTCYDTAGDTTLYAHWTANTYNVTLNRNIATGTNDFTGGSYATGTTSLTATYDDTYPDITVPVRNGYTFNGYYTDATGGEQVYNSSGGSSLTYTTADDQTLYAHWTANTISITLDQQSGTNGTTAFKYTYDTNKYYNSSGEEITSITIPTRTGYTFGGYYTSTGGSGTQYITSSGGFTNSLFKNIYASSTLYAKWTENSYTIAFNANGGSGSMNSITGVLYTASQTLTTNAFYRYGYLFKGWAKTAVAVDADIYFYDQHSVSKLTATNGATVTLYAVWEKTWAADTATPSGAGTQTNPYLISTPQHLGWMAYQTEIQNLSGYFKQTAHISLAGETYLPIGNSSYKFIGNYDGNNYVITNLTTTETRIKSNTGNYKYSYQGLFGSTSNATIDNVKLLSGTIKGCNYTGGIAGNFGASTITNSQVGSVSIYANYNYSGGLAGYFYNASATACYSKAQMSGGAYYGGIGGYFVSSTFTACAFEGTLASIFFGYQMTGGISNNGTKLYDCFGKTEKRNEFVRGSFKIDSCLHIAGTTKKYYSGNFTNWVITTTNTPLPQGLSWLATGGTKVTSVNEIIALGYTAA